MPGAQLLPGEMPSGESMVSAGLEDRKSLSRRPSSEKGAPQLSFQVGHTQTAETPFLLECAPAPRKPFHLNLSLTLPWPLCLPFLTAFGDSG